jgi:hypothetical protein
MKPASKAVTRGVAGALAVALASAGLVVTGLVQASAPGSLTFIANSRTVKPSVDIASLDGSNPRRLGPGMSAAISPSGAYVAAVELVGPQDNTSSELVLYRSAGGGAKKLYRHAGFLQLFGWSANSKLLLAWVSGANNRGPLLEINASSGSATTLASGVIEGASFAPNSSGDVVFALAKSLLGIAPVNLFVNLPSGGPALQLTRDGHSIEPLWGPKAIIFARETSRGAQDSPINQLWKIAPSGGKATQLTHMSVGPLVSGLVPIAISRNGQHLLAEFGGTDTSAAWAVNLGGGPAAPRALAGTDGNIPDAISRNGETVLLTRGFEGAPTSVETIPWAGGKPTVLSKHGADASWNF